MTHVDLPRRMYHEAISRIHDADILSSTLSKKSDSDAIVRILGFEVLLKCALLVCSGKLHMGHSYAGLWRKIPQDQRQSILVDAKQRMPGHSNLEDIEKLLDAYERIFMNARYSYEENQDLSDARVRKKGEVWLEQGAKDEDADFVYYPMELECLIHGLCLFIEKRLPAHAP